MTSVDQAEFRLLADGPTERRARLGATLRIPVWLDTAFETRVFAELINSVDFLPGSRGTNLGAVASLTWIPSMAPFH